MVRGAESVKRAYVQPGVHRLRHGDEPVMRVDGTVANGDEDGRASEGEGHENAAPDYGAAGRG